MSKRRMTSQAKYDIEETAAEIEDLKEDIANLSLTREFDSTLQR